MGRVQKVADQGEPGKFYFPEPITLEIKGKVDTTTPTNSFPKSSGAQVLNMTPGRCRLESSHKLYNYTPPDDCVYDMTEWPQSHQVSEYLRKMEIAGFGEGAIVTRRYQNAGRWKHAHQWGIVVITHKVAPSASRYRPYTVRWFSNNEVEPSWAEDLVVIHSYLEESLLADIVESQGVEVNQS